jgi:hypothetical protein
MDILKRRGSITANDGQWSASICWAAADSPPIEYIEALMRWAKDLKDWEAEIKDGLPDVGMLSYVVVNSGDYLRYTLSDQDIKGLLGGKYEWSPGELLGWELNEPVNSWVWVPLRAIDEKVVKREIGI